MANISSHRLISESLCSRVDLAVMLCKMIRITFDGVGNLSDVSMKVFLNG